ncbi:MAG TPA: DUF2238 domain-containing protein [Candidatus Moranbacteria bacterium]|nr:DUF2238 domain-containing protein [Candidatus Moranbacteria bacterium]
MKFKKGQLTILLTNVFFILTFSAFFITRANYEFLLYIGVLIFFVILILITREKVNYSNGLLWGLSIWALAHMAGGGIILNNKLLYSTMLLPIIGEPYYILKYDQLVHAFGFGITTLLMWTLLKPLLKNPARNNKVAISILLVMAATGAGALNEVIEFIATVISPESGVGGYINNALDLVFNLIGALIALLIIAKKESFFKK